MGLDMYLYKSIEDEKELIYWRKANQIHGWFVKHCNNDEEISGAIKVTRNDLSMLLKDCQTVKESLENSKFIKETIINGYTIDCSKDNSQSVLVPIFKDADVYEDSKLALELLPPRSGFFFGSEVIDVWYQEDIKFTIEKITALLETSSEEEFIYYASW